VYRTRVNFVVGNHFYCVEENDRCTGTWGGLSHKLFLLQEDDDLCTGTRFQIFGHIIGLRH
jgi:hypothetical protein